MKLLSKLETNLWINAALSIAYVQGDTKKLELFNNPIKPRVMGKKHFIHSNWNLKICHLRNINGIYNFLKITSFRCRPPVRMHSWNLLLRFLIDRCNISAGILWISSWILCFNSSRVLSRVVYTLFLRYPNLLSRV